VAERRDARWEVDSLYTEEQVDAVLSELGIRIQDEYADDFLGYCPFHGNNDTPSFAVSKQAGLYVCYNPACGVSGTFLELTMKIGKLNPFEAARLISKNKVGTPLSFEERLAKELATEPDWTPFSQDVLARCHEDFWASDRARQYMAGRGFYDETLGYFRIGYSEKRDAVMVPMHNPDGLPIGVIGRSITGKDFKNSKGLPKNKTAWNFHRAKREGDTVIVCEASFDAMRIHQAGYRNVVALLGGTFSPFQQQQLARSFNTVILMTDFDKKQFYQNCAKCKRAGAKLCKGHNPGEELGASIVTKMRGKRVLWAHCGGATRFPEGVKDAGDMSETEIRHCIANAVSNLEYVLEI
jgi:DNA primase